MKKRIMLTVLITITFVAGVFLTKPLIIEIVSHSLNNLYISNNDNVSNLDKLVSKSVAAEQPPTPAPLPEPVPTPVLVEPKPEILAATRELEVLRLVNNERQKDGKKPLTYLSKLEQGADIRALEIIELWSHTRPDGTVFVTAFEYMRYQTLGENLAAGYTTPKDVVEGWMSSVGHRLNMLNEEYEQMAIAVSEDAEGKLYWVQILYRGK